MSCWVGLGRSAYVGLRHLVGIWCGFVDQLSLLSRGCSGLWAWMAVKCCADLPEGFGSTFWMVLLPVAISLLVQFVQIPTYFNFNVLGINYRYLRSLASLFSFITLYVPSFLRIISCLHLLKNSWIWFTICGQNRTRIDIYI